MLKHKALIMVSVLVLVLAVVAMSCAPAKPATPPAPVTPPVVTPPPTPPAPPAPPATPTTPTTPTPPAAPAIVEKVTSYSSQKFSNDMLSIAYPAEWTSKTPPISSAVFTATKDKDAVLVIVTPATDFKAAASAALADVIKASGASFTPSIDSETTVTLADGTKANVILLSAAFGMAKAAVTGVIKGGNAIMVLGASVPGNLAIYQEIGSTLIVK